MVSNDIYVIVPFSLDGAGAYLTVKWFLEPRGYSVKLIPTTKDNFQDDFNSVVFTDAKKIYIVGGFLTEKDPNFEDKCDRVTLFKLDVEQAVEGPYKVISGNYQTFTSLMYNSFKTSTKTDVDDKKRLLLALIQDYVTYELKYQQISIGVNYIFSNFSNYLENRLEKFCKKYENGFDTFTDDDKKVIKYYNSKLEKILQNDKYVGFLPFGDDRLKVVSTFADKCVNEVAAEIIKKYSCDIAILVNPELELVTFRRSPSSKINLKALAGRLCNGDGKEYAASGKITEKFLEFTKILQKEVP